MSDLTVGDLLARVVDDGIAAARADYAAPGDAERLEGSVAGFEACRGRTPVQLAVLLDEVRRETRTAYAAGPDPAPSRYWYWRCREAEVEWVCNVLSAVLANEGLPVLVPPTCRGVAKAAEIVGVA